ncbi:MAG: histidinol dehydrogenase, partial [Herbiconiux sp.]|nr:histidinol dehydrogenase [Herbiconiux sp.]
MISRIDLRGAAAASTAPLDYRSAVPRAEFDVEAAVPAVHAICEAVRTRGLEAITEFSERFDGCAVDDIRVPASALAEALERLNPDVLAGLEESVRRLRATCAAELEQDAVT